MNRNIKLFSRQLQALVPNVSNRFLDDLSTRIVPLVGRDRPSGNTDRQLKTLTLFSTAVQEAIALSPAFARAWGAKTTCEIIYLTKAVHVSTTSQELADLLGEGIRSVTGYNVEVLQIDLGDFGRNIAQIVAAIGKANKTTGHTIIILHAKEGEELEKVSLASGLLDEIPIHRIVHVVLPHSPHLEAEQIENLLHHDDLVHEDQAHYGSYIPTMIVPKPDRRWVKFKTMAVADHHEHGAYRAQRDSTVLSADECDPTSIPRDSDKLAHERDRWARNVTNLQVGFATSGGGASAFRTIAILERFKCAGLTVDVFGGLSGGAVVGAYYAGDEENGLERVLDISSKMSSVLPEIMFTTKPIERVIDEELNYQHIGQTSMKFCAVTTELRKDKTPSRRVVKQGTLGQAVRTSGSMPGIFAPTTIDGHLYTDGMASSIVPAEIVVDHGGDIVLACNCNPGPNRTNPFGDSPLGRAVYNTSLGRSIDLWTWINFLVQNASTEYGHGCDVYYEFNPENISSLEAMKFWDARKILNEAREERGHIDECLRELKDDWDAKCRGTGLLSTPLVQSLKELFDILPQQAISDSTREPKSSVSETDEELEF